MGARLGGGKNEGRAQETLKAGCVCCVVAYPIRLPNPRNESNVHVRPRSCTCHRILCKSAR